jgi:putative FmdB family regulatory protein
MPTYDYECPACGKVFEAFQPITAPAAADCPACGAASKRKFSTGAGLIFKGTGFYQTDYKNKHAKRSEKKPPEGGGGSGSSAASQKDGGSGGANGKSSS